MVLPVVVIEVAPPEAHPRFPAELAAACSNAVRRGRCIVEGQGPEQEHPAAVATVTWGGRQLAVRVQVGVRRGPGTHWLMRDMHFKPADQPVERWRAVGLTIATLVGELPEGPAPPPKPAPPKPAPKPSPPKPSPPKPSPPKTAPRKVAPAPRSARAARWWVEGGAALGPGLGSGSPRGGGFVAGAFLLDDLPLLAHVSLGYAVRPADARSVSVQFLTLQAGFGVRFEVEAADLELDARAGASLQQVRASATRGGTEDSGSRVLPALHLGANVAWPGRGFIGLVAGVDAWTLQSPTHVTIEGQPAGTVAGTGVLGKLGLRLRFR